MSLATRISENVRDTRTLGIMVLARHAARLRRNRLARVRLPGYGHVWIRQGDSDMEVVRQVFIRRDYDLGFNPALGAFARARYEALLANGVTPIIVDAGANIGAATLWFARTFPKACVIAIEPDPGNAALLRDNLKQVSNARMLEAAVGATGGFVSLSANVPSWAVSTTRAESGVPVVSIPDVCAGVQNGRLFIAKIDIEGFESDLFSSNTSWVEDCSIAIIEPHDWMRLGDGLSRNFRRVFDGQAFELLICGENLIYAQMQGPTSSDQR